MPAESITIAGCGTSNTVPGAGVGSWPGQVHRVSPSRYTVSPGHEALLESSRVRFTDRGGDVTTVLQHTCTRESVVVDASCAR
jgi:hypothetical protein